MAVNSSSNDSLLPSNLPCLVTQPSFLIYIASSTTGALLLLPLSVMVLYLGFQRWRQQRSASSSAVTSHSDSFAYHMASMELLGVLQSVLIGSGIYRRQASTYSVGLLLLNITWFGQTLFHILTCVERYLAVVHPVVYLSLRGGRGIRIRNISIGGVWLIAFGLATVEVFANSRLSGFSTVIFSLVVTCFCSVSVLCALIRPGPGQQGGDRKDQSKRRAFYTMVAILGVLLLRGAASVLHFRSQDLARYACELLSVTTWLNAPSSLVLPLLFLHRAGTLACCKNTTQ